MHERLEVDCDVAIAGGGVAALLFARILADARPDLRALVIDDAAPADADKTIIIDAAAAARLRQHNALPSSSRAITQVQIALGPLKKRVGGRQPLGYSIAADAVRAALAAPLQKRAGRLRRFECLPNNAGARLHLSDGGTLAARALALACPLEELPPPFAARRLPCHQSVLSLTAACELPPGQARQHFRPRRVFVIAPRAAECAEGAAHNQCGVIICAPAAAAGELAALPDSDLSALLARVFGLPVQTLGRRAVFTPQWRSVSPLAAPPVFLLGAGAGTLHPIGAQAISLAINDACALASIFAASPTPALPAPAAAQRYHQSRARAHRRKTALTAFLALGAA